MPEQKESPLSELQLVYINGQEHGAPPVFKDVRLIRDSQQACDQLLQLAKDNDKRIRGEGDLQRCLKINRDLRQRVKQLEWLREQERKPWRHILSQIDAGVNGIINMMQLAERALKHRVENLQTEREEGRRKIEEDERRKAAELELKAKYDSNPVGARQAKVQADEIRHESKASKKLPVIPGTTTVVRHEYEIENRVLAAKLPPEAVAMETQDRWFDKKIKEAKDAGLPLPTFPGIRIIVKTEVRLPR